MTEEANAQDPWVTYRPEIKVLDCTIRDGGLINDHKFDDEFVRAVYQTCVAAGVDYMELGYKASRDHFDSKDFGPWKFSDEEDLRRIVGDNPTDMKLSVIADVGRTDFHRDILPRKDSVLDCIRVACYIHQIPGAIEMLEDAHEKGYETTLNLMAASTVPEREIRTALELLAKSPAQVVYVVDSFGTFYGEQVRDLTRMYLDAVQDAGKQVGIHAHNNQQLAYANTIEAMINGANWLDATINGLGRGAGNCTLELLLGFLKNPKFNLRPVLECIQNYFMPMRQDMEWGYQLAYMLTGQMNQHPRSAIKWRAGERPDNILEFYDLLMEEE